MKGFNAAASHSLQLLHINITVIYDVYVKVQSSYRIFSLMMKHYTKCCYKYQLWIRSIQCKNILNGHNLAFSQCFCLFLLLPIVSAHSYPSARLTLTSCFCHSAGIYRVPVQLTLRKPCIIYCKTGNIICVLHCWHHKQIHSLVCCTPHRKWSQNGIMNVLICWYQKSIHKQQF